MQEVDRLDGNPAVIGMSERARFFAPIQVVPRKASFVLL
jgi:hypothetical protein